MEQRKTGVGRCLRGISAVMAVFCGLVATALTLLVVVTLVWSATTGWTNRPVHWKVGNDQANVAAEVERNAQVSCEPGKATLCPTSKPTDIKGYLSEQLGQAMTQAPLVALVYGLFQACICFVGFARGRLLARRTVDGLVRFAVAGLVFVLVGPFAGRLGGLVADSSRKLMDLVTGDRSVLFSVSSYTVSYDGVSNLLTMIYAVTLTVIAVVMVKASAIADDHAQIV